MKNKKFRIWDDDNKVFDYFDFNDLEKAYQTISTYESYFSHLYLKGTNFLQQYIGLEAKDEKEIFEGDIIDINQTVNGQSRFVVMACLPELDIRYAFDVVRKYEYDAYELLDAGKEDTEIEIVGNIFQNLDLYATA